MDKNKMKIAFNNRNISFDFISGCLIVYMIFCHIMQWAKLTDCELYSVLQRILFFFMAWFFYKSGFYVQKIVDLKKYAMKNFRKLLLPALYFTLMGVPFVWYQIYRSGDTNIVHYTLSIAKAFILRGDICGNLPLWFLVTLFEVKLIYALLNRKMSRYIIFIVFFLLSGVFSFFDLHSPGYVFSFFTAMTLYSSGHILANKEKSALVFFFCGILYVVSILFFPQMVDIRTSTLIYGNFPLWLIVSIAACVTWNNITKYVVYYVPEKVLQSGRDSMIYYVTHWLVISYSSLLLNLFFSDAYGWKYFGVLSLMVVVLLSVSAYFLKKPNVKFLFGL